MFIKINRIKADDSVVEQYINTDYIINIRPRDNAEGSALDVSFPDTLRTYLVAESISDIRKKMLLDVIRKELD